MSEQDALVERVAEATDFYGRMVQVMKPVWRERGNDHLTDTLLLHARQLQDAYDAAIAAVQGASIEGLLGKFREDIEDAHNLTFEGDMVGIRRALSGIRAALAAAVQGAGLEALLERLTDDSLPGRDVRIGRNDGQWCVAQEYCGMDESVPTGVTGNGPTLRAAVAAALAGEDAHAERRDPYPEQYRRRRERQRISLRDVARYADLRPAQVSEWERGDRTLTVQQIRLLNEALNVLVGERA